ncbi:MAG: class I SAM-dependent methyltransferase [Thermoanaerobaculia bacterium]|nr:class I SAM-dependent methyltransferase [Thermoanaerobaculia bacterium]
MRLPIPFHPHRPDANCYLLGKGSQATDIRRQEDLPLPPPELMLGHKSASDFLDWGREHAQNARQTIEKAGFSYRIGSRLLDFGCGSGRLIRHFFDVADRCEIHGVDLRSDHIFWCKRHLNPPFHFAVTTAYPHLPFEDRYFNLVLAGSVFTHIDDLADAWFLEIWRILRPGGLFYFTIHDRHTIELLSNQLKNGWEAQHLSSFPEWPRYLHEDFSLFTLGRFEDSHIFHDTADLERSLGRHFEIVATRPEAYGYQTGLLLRRRRSVQLVRSPNRGSWAQRLRFF